MRKSVLFGLVSMMLIACGPGGGSMDMDGSSMSGNDASMMMTGGDSSRPGDVTTPRTDGGTTTREGGTTNPNDRCSATDMNASSTVGCNGGFVSGTPAANAPGGSCTGGGDMMPAGSCTGNAVCTAAMGMMGTCLPTCTPGGSYVSTGGCPMGFRCFDLEGQGICFRDCDATHACPMGQMCDGEGSCVTP